jgi:hypothetical protein
MPSGSVEAKLDAMAAASRWVGLLGRSIPGSPEEVRSRRGSGDLLRRGARAEKLNDGPTPGAHERNTGAVVLTNPVSADVETSAEGSQVRLPLRSWRGRPQRTDAFANEPVVGHRLPDLPKSQADLRTPERSRCTSPTHRWRSGNPDLLTDAARVGAGHNRAPGSTYRHAHAF